MTDNNNFSLSEWTEKILHSTELGCNLLLSKIKEETTDAKLYFRALYLKSVLMVTESDADKAEIIKEMTALLNTNRETALADISLASQLNNQNKPLPIPDNKNEIIFECKNVWKKYGNFELKNIDLKLRLGEITGVVGENGNGKSTLLKIIAGELEQTNGTLNYGVLDNKNENHDWESIKSQIAYLPQELKKLGGSIRQNIRLVAALHGIKGEDNDFATDYIINRMGLSNFVDYGWDQISGGYKLRFALTQILVWKPKLIILDEPLANLDINAQIMVLKDLSDLANSISNPISIVLSSQNIEEIEAIASKIVILRKGEMLYNGEVKNIGKERTENSFEMRCSLTLDEMKNKLSELKYNRIYFNGLSYIIDLPLETDLPEFIKYCSNKGINFSYFNDISSSSKRILFNNRLYA